MEKNKVSIIMPVYNSEKFISKAIDSVIKQTYSNWELIVIDDGSQDNSMEIIKAYMMTDSRICLQINEKNIGISQTRNKGIQFATGEYIAFLDSDDSWTSNKLERQLEIMKNKNAQFSCSSYYVVNEEGTKLGCREFKECQLTYLDLLKTNMIGCLTVMIQADIMKKNLMPNVKHEDYATWLNILQQSHIQAYMINECLAIYTKRKSSTSANKFNTISWVWTIFRREQKFSVFKSSYCLIRFLWFTTMKYTKNV